MPFIVLALVRVKFIMIHFLILFCDLFQRKEKIKAAKQSMDKKKSDYKSGRANGVSKHSTTGLKN